MIEYKVATPEDSSKIKEQINIMYGIEYEKREDLEIANAIENKTELYVLAMQNGECCGFAGASLNNDYYADIITPDIAVIDYIYTPENRRDFMVAYTLISTLIKALINIGTKQAIMQVQTYNEYRALHYSLSDKNIIKSTPIEHRGQMYEDQILLIQDLKIVVNMTIKDIIKKAHGYNKEIKKGA